MVVKLESYKEGMFLVGFLVANLSWAVEVCVLKVLIDILAL